MSNDISAAVCKTTRSLGFSSKRASSCADWLDSHIRTNGAVWVLDRLKSLEDYYVDPERCAFPEWMRKTRRSDGLYRPKGDLGLFVGSHTKRETIITVLGTVRTSIVLDEPTEKQLQKFYDGVVNPPIPSDRSYAPIGLEKSVPWLERKLEEIWSERPFFGPGDVHGKNIPFGTSFSLLRYDKKRKLPYLSDLVRAWDKSISSAPTSVWGFLTNIKYTIPDVRPQESIQIFNRMRKEALDSGKRHKTKSGKTLKTKVEKAQLLPVGHVNFLQKPSGKLRTVANPNRLVQWALFPFGDVLSDWVNSQSGVYVKNQNGAIEWVQNELKLGHHLTSADLSSASDTLDFVKVLEPLLKQPASSLIRKNVDFFAKIAKMPWYLNNEVARSALGVQVISWKQGQPLGLRPSFPVLTMTNLAAAQRAVVAVDGHFDHRDPPFAIVGDDIVIRSRYAEKYREIITGFGGVINLDKSMQSDKQAEICSRLVEPNNVIRLKARYLQDDTSQNILTYQNTGLKVLYGDDWEVRLARSIGAYSLREVGILPSYNPSKVARLLDKEAVNAYLQASKNSKRHDYAMVTTNTIFYHALVDDPSFITLGELKRMSYKQLCKLFELKNPGKDLWSEANSYAQRYLSRISLNDLKDQIAIEEYQKVYHDIPARCKKAAKSFCYDLATNYLVRERTGLSFFRLRGSEIENLGLLRVTAREQRVEPLSVYDHHTDTHIVENSSRKTLVSTAKSVEKAVSGLIREEDRTHMILRVPGSDVPSRLSGKQPTPVDMLLEDKGDHYDLSFVGPTSSSPTERVEKCSALDKARENAHLEAHKRRIPFTEDIDPQLDEGVSFGD